MLRMVGGTGIIGQDIICPLSRSEEFAIKTASGNPITIQSAAAPFTEMLIFGKTTQNGTPSPENPVPLDTAGASGQVNVSVGGGNLLPEQEIQNYYVSGGKEVGNFPGNFSKIIEGISGEITIKRKYAGTRFRAVTVDTLPALNSGTVVGEGIVNDTGSVISLNVQRGKYLVINMENEEAFEELMVNYGSTALPYQPYVTPQSLVVSTPTGLPGVPTTGDTYIDADGTKRIADSVEYYADGTGRYVQRTDKTIVDGTNVRFALSGSFWNLPDKSSPGIISNYGSLSKYFPKEVFSSNGDYDFIWTRPERIQDYFSTIEELNSFCVQKNSEGDPLIFYYPIEEPIITPLTAEQVEEFKALTTYEPTTVIQNDAGCWMQVKYASKNIY